MHREERKDNSMRVRLLLDRKLAAISQFTNGNDSIYDFSDQQVLILQNGAKSVQKSTELALKVTKRMPADAAFKACWCKEAGSPALRDFPSEPSEIYCFRRKCTLDFRVHVGACAARPQTHKWWGGGGGGGAGGRPQTAHTESHRLHSLIYLFSPTLSVFSRNSPPTEQPPGSRTPIPPSIYPFTSPSTSILPSILLHMTCGPPSSVFVSHSSSLMGPHNILDFYAAPTSADSGKNYYLL